MQPPPLPAVPGLDAAIGDRLDVAVRAACRAGGETLGLFTDPHLAVETKADASPVTAADRSAEALLRRELLAAFPADAFLGEEGGVSAGTSGYEWVVDPIDGTKSFIRGVPLYATLVGCRHGGRGILGVIVIPALGELVYAATGGGAWHVRGDAPAARARVSSRPVLSEALVCTSDFTSFGRRSDAAAGRRVRDGLERESRLCRTWGDGYGYLLVATGRADVMIDPLMNPWDAAAVETVVVEAGGRFSDWRGGERIDSGDGLATNGRVHDDVLRLIRAADGGG